MDINNEDDRYYYDNCIDMEGDDTGNVFIDRIYRLDYEKFTKLTWDKLGKIYSLLPQYINKENCCPMWFGDIEIPEDEIDNVEFYLSASVEPPGIQVSGYLKYEDWLEWERNFHKYIFELPFREW